MAVTSVRVGAGSTVRWMPVLVGIAAFAALLSFASRLLADPDIYWHVEVGRWIVEHRALPFRDPFSFTRPGEPWHVHEWLAALVFWAVFRIGGWAAVAALSAAAAALSFALLADFLRQRLEPRHALLLLAASFAVASQHLLARPHILSWPLIVIWVGGLVDAAERRSAPSPGLLAVMTLWANLHGGYPFGLAVVVPFALECVWQAQPPERLRLLVGWAGFGTAAFLASLITPHGPLEGAQFALQFLKAGGFLGAIGEWQSADFQQAHGLEIWLMGLLALGLLGLARLPPLRALFVLGLLHLSLTHIRHAELLGLAAPLAMAGPLARCWYGPDPSIEPCAAAPCRLATVVAVFLTGYAALVAAVGPSLEPSREVTPAAALAAARTAGLTGPVFNSYNFGGYLIYAGVPTFIDGRADFFGADFMARYVDAERLVRPRALEELLDRYRIGWTLLEPRSPAVQLLDRMPGWVRVYGDDVAVIHSRASSAR
jgi:hypothetical protein